MCGYVHATYSHARVLANVSQPRIRCKKYVHLSSASGTPSETWMQGYGIVGASLTNAEPKRASARNEPFLFRTLMITRLSSALTRSVLCLAHGLPSSGDLSMFSKATFSDTPGKRYVPSSRSLVCMDTPIHARDCTHTQYQSYSLTAGKTQPYRLSSALGVVYSTRCLLIIMLIQALRSYLPRPFT